jgi:hypothetical protein
MADIADHIPHTPSSAADDSAASDVALVALIEKRLAVVAQIHTIDDDVDAAFDELDRVDAQIAATPANSLGGIRCKAGICHELACSDADLAWPMLSSLMRDLAHVPLDDVTLLRSIFAKLAVSVPPRGTQDVAGEEDI